MKKILLIACILFVKQNYALSQNIKCNRQANFGKKTICLPQIDGYQECYTDPIVKQLADATEVPINTVLGFYLSNRTHGKKDSLGLISFDDYFKVYGTKEIENLKCDESLLEQMIQVLSANFITRNWEELSKEIDKIGLDAEIGVPVVIENYRLNTESFTMVMLTKYGFEGLEPYTLAMTINGYLKNERLIWMAYYLNYEDQLTIQKLKDRSNIILQELITAAE